MKSKKFLAMALAGAAALVAAGCNTTDTGAFDGGRPISVVTREEASGTRDAFTNLFGLIEKSGDKTIDHTTEEAVTTEKTSVMMTTVAGNEYAIGYISLGSLDDTVKALKIDGAEASVDAINSGSYKIFRPFLIVTKDGVSEAAQDFIAFILSADGQKVIADNGYIQETAGGAFQGSGNSGKVVVAGSSSVTPVMEKLKEAYLKVNSAAVIEIQQSDSGAGIKNTVDGICDIGMSSRELKESETASVKPTVIAKDGIAVIVNKKNPAESLTSAQVKSIFTGEAESWSDVD